MPKMEAAFRALPLGSIKPLGWLKDQLRIQADGFTGHLEEHWPDVGPDNGWLGGKGDSWERGPYYLDGLVPLAHLLEDEQLIRKAEKWIEWTLASQREDGFFGPDRVQTVNSEVRGRHDWWHYMIMLKVLTQHAEATGDERVVPFMSKFFRYVLHTIEDQPLREWAQARGADMLLSIFWLHERTGEPFLLELADIVSRQTLDWTGILADFPFWRKVETWDHRTHVVNVAMGVKTPGLIYLLSGDPKQKEAVVRGIRSLMTYHGQAHGMFSGDEWLSGTHPSQGVELCAVVEYMFTMEHLVRIFGDGQFGDILEKVAFNALPAAVSSDWTSHQYDQQVNQIICNVAPRNWSNRPDANIFGLEPNFGCCTANMHQGWPKLTSHLWMQDGNGLAAVSYAPCRVRADVGNRVPAEITVSGEYPFRETIHMKISLPKPERFPLSLRIPQWCDRPVLTVNGTEETLAVSDGFARLDREWNDGDELILHLPMEVKLSSRDRYAVSVERGPLVYVLPVGESWHRIVEREKFHDWEIYPTTSWKYGLLEGASFQVAETSGELPKQPFDPARSPVKLRTKGRLIRDWAMEGNNAGAPPMNPNAAGQPDCELELVPYGGPKLRIGEFPLIRNRA